MAPAVGFLASLMLSDLERGRDHDGERLPQPNLGMRPGRDSRLPAFCCTCPGSIADKSHLPYMMANYAELGVGASKVAFAMGGGFCATANVELMSA